MAFDNGRFVEIDEVQLARMRQEKLDAVDVVASEDKDEPQQL